MYIPKINLTTDKAEIVTIMKQFSFATLITAKNELPIATHLPFVVEEKDDSIVLTSHFAKANEQWKDIENHNVLVVFSEPHAYISTGNYEKELNVPTWNYISVHAYGQGKVIADTEMTFEVLRKTINTFEASYQQKWDNFPQEYKQGMVKGIVAFEITIKDLQAKKKLSQNKTESEQKNIIETLSQSKDTNEKRIAEYMKNQIHK
ncbi:MAG: FMN-binding negative transcriptional regulator [Leadbetterella sp.]